MSTTAQRAAKVCLSLSHTLSVSVSLVLCHCLISSSSTCLSLSDFPFLTLFLSLYFFLSISLSFPLYVSSWCLGAGEPIHGAACVGKDSSDFQSQQHTINPCLMMWIENLCCCETHIHPSKLKCTLPRAFVCVSCLRTDA